MFIAQCDNLGREVLIWPSDLHGIENTDNGVLVFYKCACGEEAVMRTGAAAPSPVSVHLDRAA